MSLDFSLVRSVPTEICNNNITHNLTNLWEVLGIYEELYNSHGKYANEVCNKLRTALDTLLKEPVYFRQYNSPNGWGTVEGAINFLTRVVEACKENPEATIFIDK